MESYFPLLFAGFDCGKRGQRQGKGRVTRHCALTEHTETWHLRTADDVFRDCSSCFIIIIIIIYFLHIHKMVCVPKVS